LYVLLIAAVGYSLAYFAPWVHVTVLWFQSSTSGPIGLEFVAFLAAAALAAVLALQLAVPGVPSSPMGVFALACGCLVFAAGELAHLAGLTSGNAVGVASLGLGLPVMVLCATVMTTVAATQLERRQRAHALMVSLPILLVVSIMAAIRGSQSQAQPAQPGPSGSGWEAASPWSGPGGPIPETRADIRVTVHTWSYCEQLATDGTLFGPIKPHEGRVFIVCDVSIHYAGLSGSVTVRPSSFVLIATNQQAYASAGPFFPEPTISLIEATLLPGGMARGNVVFEVDRGAGVREVRYTSALF